MIAPNVICVLIAFPWAASLWPTRRGRFRNASIILSWSTRSWADVVERDVPITGWDDNIVG